MKKFIPYIIGFVAVTGVGFFAYKYYLKTKPVPGTSINGDMLIKKLATKLRDENKEKWRLISQLNTRQLLDLPESNQPMRWMSDQLNFFWSDKGPGWLGGFGGKILNKMLGNTNVEASRWPHILFLKEVGLFEEFAMRIYRRQIDVNTNDEVVKDYVKYLKENDIKDNPSVLKFADVENTSLAYKWLLNHF